MYLSSIFTSLAVFVGVTFAVRCSDIGYNGAFYGQPDANGRNQPQAPPTYPDPFATGLGWDVIKAKDCWVRFQTPTSLSVASIRSARVTTTVWDANEDQVTNTMDNYGGSQSNIMLWHRFDIEALRYAGIATRTGTVGYTQGGLDHKRTVISIMLPSGIGKLRTVDNNPRRPSINTDRVHAWGANGVIAPSDYAYTSVFFMLWVMRALRNGTPELAWIAAETSTPDTCVIIDFRNFPDYP